MYSVCLYNLFRSPLDKLLIHGPVEIPLFYLLSGYSLALGYGHSSIDLKTYLRNRFARIAPLYYLAMLFFVPAYIHIGYWNADPVWVFTLTATCTNAWVFPGDKYNILKTVFSMQICIFLLFFCKSINIYKMICWFRTGYLAFLHLA